MTNIIVTGATGGLGTNLTIALLKQGYKVTALGRNQQAGDFLASQGALFCPVDLVTNDNLGKIFHEQEYVFHTAALSSPWGKYEDFYQANVIATRKVIAACQQQKIKRLINVSTPSIYFNYQDKYNISEEDPLPKNFVNHYATTKFLAEQEINLAHRQGLEVISIRPRAIFGKFDQVLLPRIVKLARKGKIPVVNNGSNLVDVTYVENVVDALLLCMQADKSCLGHHFNITNNESKPFAEILSSVMKALQINFKFVNVPYAIIKTLAEWNEFKNKILRSQYEPLLTTYGAAVLAKAQTLDITKAKTMLGYQPRFSISEGLEIYAKWYHQQNS